jgi:hypothetical protein
MSEGVGVMRLSEVLEQRLMSRTLPVSDDIQPVIDRINWPSQDRIVSAAQDNYLFFAVPLDGSTVNNAILVYNTTTAKWESVDEFPITSNVTGAPAHFENIIAAHIADVRRLIGVQTQPPMLWLMYEGNQDQIGWDNPQFSNGFPTGNWGNPTYQPITDEMETRDYGLVDQAGPNSYRRFERGSVGFDAPAGTNVKITAKMANGITRDFPAVLGKTRIRFPIKKIDRTMSLDITCNSSSSEDCNVVATSVESREIYRNAKTTPQRVNWWFRGIGDPNLIAGGIPPALPDDLYLDMATGDVWELT